MAPEPVLSSPDEMIVVGPLSIRFLVTGEQSRESLALFELTVAPGAGLPGPSHHHDAYEETIYGLTGSLTWTIDGKPVTLSPGDALCIPRGAVHRFVNPGETASTVLVAVTPAGIGPEYFREIAAALPAADSGPPDAQVMVAIMARYGLTAALPDG